MRWATSAAPTRMPPSVSVSVAASPLLPSNTTITCHPSRRPPTSQPPAPATHTAARLGRRSQVRGGKGQASPTCPFWMSSSLPQRASRPFVTLRCIIRLLPSAHNARVAGDACAVRLAVLRAGCVVGVLRRCVQCVVQPCGWPCGWRDGCVCGWPDGWVCGSGWARTDIDDLVVGVPHLAQRLGCAQRLDDWPGCMRPGSRSRWGEGRNRDDRAQHGGGRRFEFSLICTRRRGECY